MKSNRIPLLATLCVSLLLALAGCQDEDLFSAKKNNQLLSANYKKATSSALVKEMDGTWRATKCVPLVGEGRIVDDFSDGLVKALGASGAKFENMLDTDLTNMASFGKGVKVELLGNQLVAVRDLNRAYSGGQVAGVVYKITDTNLLTLDLLKTFWLSTYLNGQLQETHKGSSDGGALGLNLINIASNDANQGLTVSAYFEKPFDEIKMGIGGIDANILNSLRFYYAFVGENETKYCLKGSRDFPDTKVHYNGFLDTGWTSFGSHEAEQVIDGSSLTDGASMAVIKAGHITIDTGKEIPVGSEVGFVITGGSLIELGIGSKTTLETYDANDKLVEKMSMASVLGLSAIGGGKTAISIITTKPCRQLRVRFSGLDVDLGVTTINYAYVKDPVVVDPSSYFVLNDVTITGNAYYLSQPEGGNVSWVILDFPAGVAPKIEGNKISGMTVDGKYVVSGTFTNAEGVSVTSQMVITRDTKPQESGCNQKIDKKTYGATACTPIGTTGGLINITSFTNAQNVVAEDWTKYASYLSVLSLASSTGIIAVETDPNTPVNPGGKSRIKTGFVMQLSGELLGADVLKFFMIKLYRNGSCIKTQAVDNSDVADVGLIGSKGNKIRVGFTTNLEFDRIELWSVGVLNLKVSEYRIYGAYVEDANTDCISADPAEACIEMLTPASHGASINYSKTGEVGGAAIGLSFDDMGNLIDSDMNTYALVTGLANLANGTTVSVKFDEINDPNATTNIGFILRDPKGILNAGLLEGNIVQVYHNGSDKPVASTNKGEGELLDLNVIGYSGRYFLETTVKGVPFDEVRITFVKALLGALETMELSGAYIRRDSDSDGIPDCSEDAEQVMLPDITEATTDPHVCLRGYPSILVNVTGGQEGKNYTLHFYDKNSGSELKKSCILENGQFVVTTQDIQPGDYYIRINDENDQTQYNGIVEVMVHPIQTMWKADARTTDWNNWANWSDGVPWYCTDAVIPSNCRNYPVLLGGEENNCRNIHFCSGAEVVNTHYLGYKQAWVELSVTGGRYYMLSAPLKDMVTGDMFIPANKNGNHGNHDTWNYFEELNKGTAVESRLTPTVFQRLWSSEAKGLTIQGEVAVTPDATLWTPPFNDLAQRYEAGMGFSMQAGYSSQTYTFRFPKTHSQYHYVYGDGSGAGYPAENILRSKVGRFIYENNNGEVAFPYTVKAKNQMSGTTFIVGNPFMAHIDIKKFMQENSAIVTSVKVYDGNTNNTLILSDGELLGTDNGLAYLAPMQAFFVTTTQAKTELDVKFTENMLVQQPDIRLYSRRMTGLGLSRTAAIPDKRTMLGISAFSNGESGKCLVNMRSGASDGYREREDARILLDNEIPPVIAVFTEADGKALDIQQMSRRVRIPLGFSMKSESEVILKLTHTSDSRWKNWELFDKQTGRRYSLDREVTQVNLGIISTHAGRFYLVKRR